MRYYEILYIVHPALEGGHLQDITKSVDEVLEKNGAKIEVQDNWGKKRLAYPIEKENYGTYILTQFQSDGSKNNTILEQLEHNSNVLASLISKIEKSELLSKDDVKVEVPAEEVAPAEEEAPAAEEVPATEEAPAAEEKKEEK